MISFCSKSRLSRTELVRMMGGNNLGPGVGCFELACKEERIP
jgi:hypothetical protein